MGIRYPIFLAVWGAAARLIPWFGALIAALPTIFLGIGISLPIGVLATIYTIAIFLALELVIEPRFFPRYKYSSLLIVLFVIALAEIFGLTGVVLAPPLAVAVQILFRHLYPMVAPSSSSERSAQVTDISKRLFELKRRLQQSRNREAIRLLDRLQRLVKRTVDTLQEY